jgi:hypothetical protein
VFRCHDKGNYTIKNKSKKENTMKNLMKIASVSVLIIIGGLLLVACGSTTEQLARNQGDVKIAVTNSSDTPLSGVLVEVRDSAGSGTFTNLGTTSISGQLTFTGTAGKDYYFQFSKTGFTTQTDIQRTPQLNSDVQLNVILN